MTINDKTTSQLVLYSHDKVVALDNFRHAATQLQGKNLIIQKCPQMPKNAPTDLVNIK